MYKHDVLLKEYGLWMELLLQHFRSTWFRFYLFTTLQSAMAGFFWSEFRVRIWWENAVFCAAAFFLSVLWFGFVRRDRTVSAWYRERVGEVRRTIVAILGPETEFPSNHPGEVPDGTKARDLMVVVVVGFMTAWLAGFVLACF